MLMTGVDSFRNSLRAYRAAFAVVAIGALTGCSTAGVPVAQPTSTSCPPEMRGDPWIAFESPLQSTDRLKVGDRGFITTDTAVEDVVVGGDAGSVRLDAGEFVDVHDCGSRRTVMRWVEVYAVRPGLAKISLPSSSSAGSWTVTLTIGK